MAKRRLAVLFAASILPLTLGAVALAGSSKQDPSRSERVSKVFNRAEREVQRDPSCRTFPRRPRKPSFTDGRPSARLLSTLALLRRPESADEQRLATSKGFPSFGVQGIYRDYIRIATAASGHQFVIFVVRDADPTKPRPERCRAELRRRFSRQLEGRPAGFRRFALRALRRRLRGERQREARGPMEGVFVFDRSFFQGRSGGGGGGGGVREIRRRGSFSASGIRGADGRARVDGLVPDGVATITATFDRVGSRLGRQRPRRYRRVIKRTVSVQENVVSFVISRAPQDAFAARMVWRSADGSVLRVVRSPF